MPTIPHPQHLNHTVRRTQASDAAGVAALQRACFPSPFPEDHLFTAGHVMTHVALFRAGQYVAVLDDGSVVASASSMLVTNLAWSRHSPWHEATGGLALTSHDAKGDVLCGIDISVHPEFRGQGIAGELYQARFDLVRELKLTMYGTVCRIPDFASEVHGLTPHGYAQAVVDGWRRDRTLTPLLRIGLTYRGVILNYMDDKESGDAGAVLEWKP